MAALLLPLVSLASGCVRCEAGDACRGPEGQELTVTGTNASAYDDRQAVVRAVNSSNAVGVCGIAVVTSGTFVISTADNADGDLIDRSWDVFVLLNADTGSTLDAADTLFVIPVAGVPSDLSIAFDPAAVDTASIAGADASGAFPIGTDCDD